MQLISVPVPFFIIIYLL